MHLRKPLILLLAAVLLLTGALVVGCGGDGDEETTTTSEDSEEATETTEDTATDTTEAAEAETFELSVAHIWPAGHAIETDLVQPWGEAISEATDGNVTITSYPGQTLLTGPEIYEGVTKGVADVGVSVYAYNAGRFPVVEAFLLPGISWDSAVSAGKALTEGIEQLDPEELKDTHHLMSFSTGPGQLLMKTPVENLEDLQGVELGATAGPRGDALEMLGATPVVMPMPDVYEAQSRGVIEGVIGPYEALVGFKLVDVTDYITETPFLYVQHFFMTMNKDKWESMPAEYQEAITEVTNQMYEDSTAALFDRLNEEALESSQAEKDIEITTLSEEETAKWKEQISPVFEEYQAKLDEQGMDGEMILDTVRELADKYNE